MKIVARSTVPATVPYLHVGYTSASMTTSRDIPPSAASWGLVLMMVGCVVAAGLWAAGRYFSDRLPRRTANQTRSRVKAAALPVFVLLLLMNVCIAASLILHARGGSAGARELRSRSQVTRPASIEVPMVTLDQQLSAPFDYWKIDVEGLELKVLEGATRNLAENAPNYITIEIYDVNVLQRTNALLAEFGYHCRQTYVMRERPELAFREVPNGNVGIVALNGAAPHAPTFLFTLRQEQNTQ